MATLEKTPDHRADPAARSPYYGYAAGQANAVALHEVLQILRRHRWLVGSLVLAVSVLSGLAGLLYPPQYRSTALVAINPAKSAIDGLEGVAERLKADDSSIETQLNVIRSAKILSQVATNLNLATDRRFMEPSSIGSRLASFWPSVAGQAMPESWASPSPDDGRNAGVTVTAPLPAAVDLREITERLTDGLKVAQAGRSQAIEITYGADDPHLAADIANEIARVYAGWQLGDQQRANERAYGWLDQRLQVLKGEVAQAEAAVERHRLANGLQAEGSSFANDQLKEYSSELIEVRAKLASAKARIGVINGLRGLPDSLERLGKIVDSSSVEELRKQELDLKRRAGELLNEFGDRHPRVIELRADETILQENIEREIDLVISKFKNELDVLQNMEANILAEIGNVKGQLGVDQDAVIRLRELEREAESSRSLYESLLIRYKELREQESVLTSDVQLVEEALPAAAPSSPSPLMFAAIGFMASSFLGAAAAIARDRMDGTVRSSSQLERATELRGLGLIPRVRGLWQEISASEFIKDKPLSAYVEGLRSLYLAIQRDPAATAGKVVLVTSALPSEGKTSATVGLASFIVSLGHRTLVIDLDLRKPTLVDKLGVRVGPGSINEVLDGKVPPLAATATSLVARLDYIGATPTTRDPAALLDPAKIEAALVELRQAYDYILIDSPPVLMMADTNLIVKVVDQTVVIARWGYTAVDAVVGAVDELVGKKARIAGFVLNLVDMKRYEDYAVAYRDPRGHYTYVRGYYRE
jgi:uncharacterized protein involved in exopolysaccharide biosynthesis/Mrp family chromosome partitioning ATPase